MKYKTFGVTASLLFSSMTSYPKPPKWWAEKGVVKLGDDVVVNNDGVANIGQAKWFTTQCYEALGESMNPELGFALDTIVPPKPVDAGDDWYMEQNKVLNLGQLKFLSSRFYKRLNELAPQWVETQMMLNGIEWPNDKVYPWDQNTAVAENYALANVGQLKLVYSLRFDYDEDKDGNSDLQEYIFINKDPNDQYKTLADVSVLPNGDDSDGDGLTDEEELALGTSPNKADHDEDGLLDGRERDLGRNPLWQDHPAVMLEVF